MAGHSPELGSAGERDAFYKVPVIRHAESQGVDFGRGAPAVHAVPVAGFVVYLYVDLRHSGDLFVVFHGALNRARDRYPRFDRITTTRARQVPFLAVADPALELDPRMTLSWYVGTETRHLVPVLANLLEERRLALNSRRIVLIGGSGGGFAALQISRALPGSLAFVFSPQTDITRYHSQHVRLFLDVCFAGSSVEEALADHGRRLSVVANYVATPSQNAVYYLQNTNDPHHVKNHMRPLAQALGAPAVGGLSTDGRCRFVMEPSSSGHGPPPADAFERHLAAALAHAEQVFAP